jgi:hypothetical protein
MTDDVLSRFEAQLRALPAQRERRRAPRRRTLVVAALAAAVATPALAATAPWRPLLGDDHRGHPAASADVPSAAALRSLAVLRRPQGEVDRGPLARRALRFFGTATQEIMTAHVRVLRSTGPAAGITLVPVKAYSPPGTSKAGEQLCLYMPDRNGDGGAQSCVPPGALREQLPAELGPTLYGLVPDGVARVRIEMRGGPPAEAEVRENLYAVEVPKEARGGPVSLKWLDDGGSAILRVRPGA